MRYSLAVRTRELSSDQLPWALVGSLSLAQLVSWGTIFYAFTLFMDPMTRELGWSKPELAAAYSLGLAASSAGALPVGRLIDLGYGRVVMTGGSILAAILLLAWAGIESYAAFLAVWIGLGFAMSATLYEAGFAVLTRSVGSRARRAITAMTLVGGLASTVFLPVTHLLIESFGWRMALAVLAGLNIAVCAGIHAVVIPGERRPNHVHTAVPTGPAPSSARRVLASRAFWGFMATAVLNGMLFTGFSVHLIPLLVERGFALGIAVAAFSLIGPAQVAARIVVALAEFRLSMRSVGLLTIVLPVAAFALLAFVAPGSGLVVVFAVLYGAANGMMTVVRGVLPSEIFGRADYGTIQGMIAAPTTLARAAGPLLFGLVWSWSGGYGAVVALGLALALAALISFATTVYAARPGEAGG
ncbi:MAG TPA: MFS transporter [Beijerinckiaceae bacterium]|nr:MFS transporter [Beijerinckiaceae bacterium]